MDMEAKEDIDSALRTIDEDYITCFKMIRKIYDYLDSFGLKEFNKYSQYKWSYDRDRSKRYSYVCIRYGSSLSKKCLVKRRAYVEDADLYKWVEHKELIQEALEEAYQYISARVNAVKTKIESLKSVVEEYKDKLDDISQDYDEAKLAGKELRDDVPEDDAKKKVPDKRLVPHGQLM